MRFISAPGTFKTVHYDAAASLWVKLQGYIVDWNWSCFCCQTTDFHLKYYISKSIKCLPVFGVVKILYEKRTLKTVLSINITKTFLGVQYLVPEKFFLEQTHIPGFHYPQKYGLWQLCAISSFQSSPKRFKCPSRVIFQRALTMAQHHQLGGGAFQSLARIKANGPTNKNKHTHVGLRPGCVTQT